MTRNVPSYQVSDCEVEFQSLAQMKVGHRHCEPFSFSPRGPRGRGQIQNARPRFIPGFLVVRLIHGSWWLSHLGTAFFVNSFVQSSLLTIGSTTESSVLSLPGEGCADEVPVDVMGMSAVVSGGCDAAGAMLGLGAGLLFLGDAPVIIGECWVGR